MKINGVSSISFSGRIIDSHAHIGSLNKKRYDKNDLDVFIKSPLQNNDTVEKMLVSDLDVLSGEKPEFEGNEALLNTLKKDNHYAVLASCNPKDGNVKNIEKLFKKYPNQFIGLKFHPDIQGLALTSEKYEPYLKFAEKHNLPCLFHSQVKLIDGGKVDPNNIHISDPENIYSLAKKYPKTPIVMAHLGAGWNESHDKATDVLVQAVKNKDANIYADISWVDIDNPQTHIVKAIKKLKGIGEDNWQYGDQSYRLMFGTDAPIDRFKEADAKTKYSGYVDSIKTAIKKDNDLKADAENTIDNLFYNNAKNLYLSKQSTSYKSIIKPLAAITAVGLLGFGLYKFSQFNFNKDRKTKKINH